MCRRMSRRKSSTSACRAIPRPARSTIIASRSFSIGRRRARRILGNSFRVKHRAEAIKMDFTGKVALITGGGNGIGRATSAAFARHGAKVVVVDRDAAGAQATAGIIRQNGGEALAVTADVTRSEDVKAYVRTAIETFGRI